MLSALPAEGNCGDFTWWDLISSHPLPNFPNCLGVSPGRGVRRHAGPPPGPGPLFRRGRCAAGVGPASAAARRRLGRAPLLRSGTNYKVAPAAAAWTAREAGEAGDPSLRCSRGDAEDREGEARPLSWLYPHRVAPDPVSPTDLRAPNSGNPMARFLGLCTWLLALGPGLLATVRAECSQDCATCSYRLARPTDLNPLACTLECEGKLPSLKTWETCKELLQLTKLELPPDATSALSKQEESHLLAKKYGGFMKRYGGFMKKMDELYPLEAEEEANGGEVLGKRYGGFMKKGAEEDDGLGNSSNLLKELLGAGDQREGSLHQEGSDAEDVSKRYGGFMRGLKRSPHLEDETKELQKRYGGFMRRVGRPEWWMDYQKRYGGFLKRFAEPLPSEEEGESYSKEVPEMEKRYGGFMRF